MTAFCRPEEPVLAAWNYACHSTSDEHATARLKCFVGVSERTLCAHAEREGAVGGCAGAPLAQHPPLDHLSATQRRPRCHPRALHQALRSIQCAALRRGCTSAQSKLHSQCCCSPSHAIVPAQAHLCTVHPGCVLHGFMSIIVRPHSLQPHSVTHRL